MNQKVYQKIVSLWREGLPEVKAIEMIILLEKNPTLAAEKIVEFVVEPKNPQKITHLKDEERTNDEPTDPANEY